MSNKSAANASVRSNGSGFKASKISHTIADTSDMQPGSTN